MRSSSPPLGELLLAPWRRVVSCIFFAWWAVLAAGGVGCRSNTEPQADQASLENDVPFNANPPVIDGVLGDAWSDAFHGELRLGDGRSLPRYRTRYHLLWSASALLLAFECEDPDVSGRYTKRDEPLYLDEVVEVFLDPDADRKNYVEIEVSPRNVLFDASFRARRQGMDLAWDPPLQSAVAVDGTIDDDTDHDRGWAVELSVPFAALEGQGRMPPRPGDAWRVNLFRLDKSFGREEASMLRPAGGDFHNLDAFATVRFSAPGR
ncbi:MAG: hypothetical protein GYA21_02205 [Myxococcales bacterium]|nr:hypothetical protein [Myxococcales bacterium]